MEDYRRAFLALTVQKRQLHGIWASEFSQTGSLEIVGFAADTSLVG